MIESVFILSMICVSVHSLTREGAILEHWQLIALDKNKELRSQLFNPVSECLFCMSTFWTCIYLSNQVELYTKLMFLALFVALLSISVVTLEKESSGVKFSYLMLVLGFILQTETTSSSLILLFCVNGLNYIIAQLLSYIELYKEKELY